MPTPNEFTNYQFPTNRNIAGGEFAQTANAPPAPTVPVGTYPNVAGGYESDNRQFTSKMSGDPKELLEQTRAGVEAHADLMQAYGYKQPIATLGCHPWLRDELATTTELEPGNAEPSENLKTPTITAIRGGR